MDGFPQLRHCRSDIAAINNNRGGEIDSALDDSLPVDARGSQNSREKGI